MQVEIVVVGAGIVGLEVAWHLREAGIRRLAVIDRGAAGRGATAHGAGLLSHFAWNPLDARLVRRSAELYASQQAELGGSFFRVTGSYVVVGAPTEPGAAAASADGDGEGTRVGPRDPGQGGDAARHATGRGGLPPTGAVGDAPQGRTAPATEEVIRRLRRRVAMLRAVGVAVEAVDPAAGIAAVPAWNWDDIAAAWFLPHDGALLPGDGAQLLARRLRQREVKVLEGSPVRELATGSGPGGPAVAGVHTAEGPVAADVVVVAAGVWTRSLLRTAGLDAPIKPYRTQLSLWALPEGIDPDDVPPLHDVTGAYYWLPRQGLLAVGDGTGLVEEDPDAFRRDPDPEFLAASRRRLEHRMPAARGAEAVGGWAHLCDATPDRRPLLGPYGGVAGLHLAVGFNGFGVMRAPAVGELVAAFVLGEEPALGGEPVAGIESLRADRFDGFVDFPIGQGFNTVDAD